MAVDPSWLASIRQQNQKKVGLAGMGASEDLSAAMASTAQRQVQQQIQQMAAAQAAAAAAIGQPAPVEVLPIQQGTPQAVKYLLMATGAVLVVGVLVKLVKARKR